MILFGLLFILLTAIPTLRILCFPETLEGSTFLYLPSVGACLVLALCIKADLSSKEKIVGPLSLIFLSALTVLFFCSHMTNSRPWKRAGTLPKEIPEQAMNLVRSLTPPQQVYIRDLPDNIQSAYVFRNGFSACLDLKGKPEGLEIIDLKKIPNGRLKEKGSYKVLAWKQGRFFLYQASGRELMR